MVSRAATSGATRKEEHLSVLAVWGKHNGK